MSTYGLATLAAILWAVAAMSLFMTIGAFFNRHGAHGAVGSAAVVLLFITAATTVFAIGCTREASSAFERLEHEVKHNEE
ncbi:hypothetical protein [Usitatibacter rugosus]|uniref:hypothetical protein n=1 Tax=Usitatibacter rugosus TaxID=2732067 RepID=UPI001488898D|nr:hypothetical protein [Usitatibacter rugosus]